MSHACSSHTDAISISVHASCFLQLQTHSALCAVRVFRVQAGRSGVRIPAGARFFFLLFFFLLPKYSDHHWIPPSLLFIGYRNPLSGVKRPGREMNHSPTSSAEGKNGWSYTSAPPVCLYGVDWEKFTFTLSLVFVC